MLLPEELCLYLDIFVLQLRNRMHCVQNRGSRTLLNNTIIALLAGMLKMLQAQHCTDRN
ncbi:hypothetical protein A628_04660 [Salmonella enterica subsp. enterica serovar Cubana str. 76814]|uniref:Uncharacterized protein n=1 Tax=Salmonella enterica subsp. enterica serovar Cubana str. 76814 TaxID=1192560 RepID=V7IGH7_SALET|nr:hypothetical protein A628_04660 [Salmonella enterica subsp. enterica serovar Cubana str. 76814]